MIKYRLGYWVLVKARAGPVIVLFHSSSCVWNPSGNIPCQSIIKFWKLRSLEVEWVGMIIVTGPVTTYRWAIWCLCRKCNPCKKKLTSTLPDNLEKNYIKKLAKTFKGFPDSVELRRRERMKERHDEDLYIFLWITGWLKNAQELYTVIVGLWGDRFRGEILHNI